MRHASKNHNKERQTKGALSISSSLFQVVPSQQQSAEHDGQQDEDEQGSRDSFGNRLGFLLFQGWLFPRPDQGEISWLPLISRCFNTQSSLWLIGIRAL